jgi:hypothetical protein
VDKRDPSSQDREPSPILNVRTPPPASLPAPMIEPIVSVPADLPVPSVSGSSLCRGLSQLIPDGESVGSGPAAASITLREQAPAGSAPPTVLGTPPPDFGPPESERRTDPRLVVIRGEKPNVAYSILDGRNYIGRCAEKPVDIDLDGQEPVERIWTSRQHAAVTWDRGVLLIEDLNSLNGTFVNRARIHPGHGQVLRIGDVVQIGTVQLRVVI